MMAGLTTIPPGHQSAGGEAWLALARRPAYKRR
jgi:hypothetical protein